MASRWNWIHMITLGILNTLVPILWARHKLVYNDGLKIWPQIHAFLRKTIIDLPICVCQELDDEGWRWASIRAWTSIWMNTVMVEGATFFSNTVAFDILYLKTIDFMLEIPPCWCREARQSTGLLSGFQSTGIPLIGHGRKCAVNWLLGYQPPPR